MKLRPYQQEAVDKIFRAFGDCDKNLAVLPTGGGKTIIFSKIAEQIKGRVLILAHREELIDQAIEKLHKATGLFADKEKAEHRASLSARIVVASIQTLSRKKRRERWPHDHFDCVICDEAHHSISKSWLAVLNYFATLTLGVTATPDRGDKKNLGQYYENVAFEISLLDLIGDGYLSPIRVVAAPLEIDLNDVKQTSGDFDAAGVASALDPFLPSIVRELKRLAPHRKILTFLPLRATSRKFVEICNQSGISAKHVDGESPDRKEILREFEDNDFQLLSNAMLLTEGYDCPDIDCVVILRPTRSRPLYSQMVGRGTRIDPFKDDLLLIDFLWAHERHNLVRPASLVAETDELAEMATGIVEREAKAGGDKQESLDLADLVSDATREREEKLAEELRKNAKRKKEEKDLAEFCLTLHATELADWEPAVKWDSFPATPRQLEILEKNGFPLDAVKGRGHASAILDVIFKRSKQDLATPKQVRLLKRLGHPAPAQCSFSEASAYLSSRLPNKPRKPRTSKPVAARRFRLKKSTPSGPAPF